MCSSHRFRIKGDPPGEGTAAQAWKGEKGRVTRGVGVRENKSRVQFFPHVAPTPPGSGVFFSLFTECVDAAFTTIPGQFAAKSPCFIGSGQTKKKEAVLQRKQFSFTFFSFIESLVLLTRVRTHQGISPCLFLTAVIFGCLNPVLLYCWNKTGKLSAPLLLNFHPSNYTTANSVPHCQMGCFPDEYYCHSHTKNHICTFCWSILKSKVYLIIKA